VNLGRRFSFNPVSFGGVTFEPGEHLYADEDGAIVSSAALN